MKPATTVSDQKSSQPRPMPTGVPPGGVRKPPVSKFDKIEIALLTLAILMIVGAFAAVICELNLKPEVVKLDWVSVCNQNKDECFMYTYSKVSKNVDVIGLCVLDKNLNSYYWVMYVFDPRNGPGIEGNSNILYARSYNNAKSHTDAALQFEKFFKTLPKELVNPQAP